VADELSCYYDGPATPANIHVELRFPGGIDGQALRLAVSTALAAHPRAMARRAGAGWWRHRREWEQPPRPDVDPVAVTTWANQEELGRVRERFLMFAPPVDCSPPLRILLAAGPGEDRLIINAHHAALDGISCLELLRTVSRRYQAGVPARAEPVPAGPALAEPSPAASARPGRWGPAGSAPPAGSSRTARPRLPGALPRLAARIMPDHHDADPGGDRPGYGFRLLALPVPAPPRTGQGPHATVNDLLITALVAAIGRWNAGHGAPGARIRITMPVNARAPGQDRVAGNLSRLAVVTARPPAAGRDLTELLARVAAQTRRAKEHAGPQVDPVSHALAALWCPAAVKRLALRMALRTAGPLLCDTCLATNLGIVADPPRFGQLAATGVWVTGPAQMPRGFSVAAITLGGQLHLGLRYSRALLSDRAAADFAGAYTAALAEVTQDAAADLAGLPADVPGAGAGR
jgi:NRPS condensation-like uncharacterized protein